MNSPEEMNEVITSEIVFSNFKFYPLEGIISKKKPTGYFLQLELNQFNNSSTELI